MRKKFSPKSNVLSIFSMYSSQSDIFERVFEWKAPSFMFLKKRGNCKPTKQALRPCTGEDRLRSLLIITACSSIRHPSWLRVVTLEGSCHFGEHEKHALCLADWPECTHHKIIPHIRMHTTRNHAANAGLANYIHHPAKFLLSVNTHLSSPWTITQAHAWARGLEGVTSQYDPDYWKKWDLTTQRIETYVHEASWLLAWFVEKEQLDDMRRCRKLTLPGKKTPHARITRRVHRHACIRFRVMQRIISNVDGCPSLAHMEIDMQAQILAHVLYPHTFHRGRHQSPQDKYRDL